MRPLLLPPIFSFGYKEKGDQDASPANAQRRTAAGMNQNESYRAREETGVDLESQRTCREATSR